MFADSLARVQRYSGTAVQRQAIRRLQPRRQRSSRDPPAIRRMAPPAHTPRGHSGRHRRPSGSPEPQHPRRRQEQRHRTRFTTAWRAADPTWPARFLECCF
jgi:hypothetical protein